MDEGVDVSEPLAMEGNEDSSAVAFDIEDDDAPTMPKAPIADMGLDQVNGDAIPMTVDTDVLETLETAQGAEEVEIMAENTFLHSDSPMKPPQLLPIEVLLSLPPDPQSYDRIDLPPSWFISKVLNEIDTGDDEEHAWYEVEFDDGRTDQVSGIALFSRTPISLLPASIHLLPCCFTHFCYLIPCVIFSFVPILPSTFHLPTLTSILISQ